jgi:hypothetical protein
MGRLACGRNADTGANRRGTGFSRVGRLARKIFVGVFYQDTSFDAVPEIGLFQLLALVSIHSNLRIR